MRAWFARFAEPLRQLRVSGIEEQSGAVSGLVPSALLHRFELLGELGRGSESVVYRVRPRHALGWPDQIALKVYRSGASLNDDLLERLRTQSMPNPHVPRLYDHGHIDVDGGTRIGWEAQELIRYGSLLDIVGDARTSPQPRDLAAALTACLRYWQVELQQNLTDVKPANLLVREVRPLQLVITDFGGVTRDTASRLYGDLLVSERYMAPEGWSGMRTPAACWWAMGIIMHEHLVGRPPERSIEPLTRRVTAVDLSAVTDSRWRLLLSGLLTIDPRHRWGSVQVETWLGGGDPPVVAVRDYAPLAFGGMSYTDPATLALDLMRGPDKAAVWLTSNGGAARLRTWLDREVRDETFDRWPLDRLATDPGAVHTAISALAAAFVPGLGPCYRGLGVDAAGVLRLAAFDSVHHKELREALAYGALRYAAQHDCGHPGCLSDRCEQLERVQERVPQLMHEVTWAIERQQGNLSGRSLRESPPLTVREIDAAWATATELVLDPGAVARHRRRLWSQSLHPVRRTAAGRVPWWREQRRIALSGLAAEPGTHAAIVLALVLAPSAVKIGGRLRHEQHLRRTDQRRRLADLAGHAVSQAVQKLRARVPATVAEGPGIRRWLAARTASFQLRSQGWARLHLPTRLRAALGTGSLGWFRLACIAGGFADGLGALRIQLGDSASFGLAGSVSGTLGSLLGPLVGVGHWLLGLIPGGTSWWFGLLAAVALAAVLWVAWAWDAGRTAAVAWSAHALAGLVVLRLLGSALAFALLGTWPA